MASCENDFLYILLSENQFDNKEQDSLVQKVQALVTTKWLMRLRQSTFPLLITHKKTKRGSAPRSVT